MMRMVPLDDLSLELCDVTVKISSVQSRRT